MTNEIPSSQEPDSVERPAEPSSTAPATGTEESARTRKRWIAAAAAALGVALFAVPLLRGPLDRTSPASRSAEAPVAEKVSGPACEVKTTAHLDFTLKDIDGASVKLTDYKGKVVLLNFWATWCGPCKLEIPEFVEAYERYRDKGFVILGVLSEDDPAPAELRSFVAKFKMNYPIFREHQEFAAANGELWALPTSFLIDRQGSICTKHTGAMTRDMLEQEIKGLL
jgi:cytochrome c biogenesis protein CcmG/thiol:disulfide interchange protein DsbE